MTDSGTHHGSTAVHPISELTGTDTAEDGGIGYSARDPPDRRDTRARTYSDSGLLGLHDSSNCSGNGVYRETSSASLNRLTHRPPRVPVPGEGVGERRMQLSSNGEAPLFEAVPQNIPLGSIQDASPSAVKKTKKRFQWLRRGKKKAKADGRHPSTEAASDDGMAWSVASSIENLKGSPEGPTARESSKEERKETKKEKKKKKQEEKAKKKKKKDKGKKKKKDDESRPLPPVVRRERGFTGGSVEGRAISESSGLEDGGSGSEEEEPYVQQLTDLLKTGISSPLKTAASAPPPLATSRSALGLHDMDAFNMAFPSPRRHRASATVVDAKLNMVRQPFLSPSRHAVRLSFPRTHRKTNSVPDHHIPVPSTRMQRSTSETLRPSPSSRRRSVRITLTSPGAGVRLEGEDQPHSPHSSVQPTVEEQLPSQPVVPLSFAAWDAAARGAGLRIMVEEDKPVQQRKRGAALPSPPEDGPASPQASVLSEWREPHDDADSPSQVMTVLLPAVGYETSVDILDLDINRTLNRTRDYWVQDGLVKEEMRFLLASFAALRPDIGYVQGMSYVAATLLLMVRGALPRLHSGEEKEGSRNVPSPRHQQQEDPRSSPLSSHTAERSAASPDTVHSIATEATGDAAREPTSGSGSREEAFASQRSVSHEGSQDAEGKAPRSSFVSVEGSTYGEEEAKGGGTPTSMSTGQREEGEGEGDDDDGGKVWIDARRQLPLLRAFSALMTQHPLLMYGIRDTVMVSDHTGHCQPARGLSAFDFPD